MRVIIKTLDRAFELVAEEGARVDELIMSAGVLLDRPCGGRGKCGKCKVKTKGELAEPTGSELELLSQDELSSGMRLSCQARIKGEAEVEIEAGAILTDKTFTTAADLDQVPGELGVAIDIGTTSVACFVTGLSEGRVYAGHAVLNRQAQHGAEVMSRLLYAENEDKLFRLAWESVREAARGLGLSERTRERVTRAVAVGNSAMHHLALGLPVQTLLRSPFEPAATEPVEGPKKELASVFPNLRTLAFAPLIGGFVGSDALSCIMYFKMERESEPSLALDLGTNGEILVTDGKGLMAASTAAGPAFEAVNISCGMRAVPGAATSFRRTDEGLEAEVIGGGPARGLTGSGLLSAVRLLLEAGAVDPSGRLREPGSAGGVKIEERDGTRSVELFPGLHLTQGDVRELQKAKGAVRAAVDILLGRSGLCPAELSRVIPTGSFGGKMGPADMTALGVIPRAPLSRIRSIPNGAGLGAAMMLDPEIFDAACVAARSVEHVELNLEPDFMDRYVSSMVLSGD